MAKQYVPQTPNDFRDFLCMVWKHLNLPDPTAIQLDIARWLADGNCPRRFILEAFRGVGKSWITVAFVLWLLDHDPSLNVLVVSASKAAADEFSNFCMQLIREMPCLAHLEPHDGQRDSKISFDVGPAPAAKAPSVKSLGITSQLTGSRADIIIADDIEVPSNSLTQGMRDKLAEQVKEFDAIIKPGGRIVFLGTPQCEQSVYNTLQQKQDTNGKALFVCRIWPSRYPTEAEAKEYGHRLAPFIARSLAESGAALVGSPTDPKRFNDIDLRERAISYGKSGYALQFQLTTRLSDADRYPLKVRDLICFNTDRDLAPQRVIHSNDPKHRLEPVTNISMPGDFYFRAVADLVVGPMAPYQGSILTIDPSGRGKDETGWCVVKMLNGLLYLVAQGGLKGGYDKATLAFLAKMACDHQVQKVEIEANFGDGMYTELFKPVLAAHEWMDRTTDPANPKRVKGYPVTVEEIKHSIQKELRICDTLEPVLGQHRLVIDPAVIEADYQSIQDYPTETAYQYSLIHQLSRITREKGSLAHDDRLDALAMAVAYYLGLEQLAGSPEEGEATFKAAALDEMLRKFLDDFASTGGPSKQKSNPRDTIWTPHMR